MCEKLQELSFNDLKYYQLEKENYKFIANNTSDRIKIREMLEIIEVLEDNDINYSICEEYNIHLDC
jgi:molybdate-binding protein